MFTFHFAITARGNTVGASNALASFFQKLLSEKGKNNIAPQVTFCDVEKCVGNLKRNKATSADKVTGEHLIILLFI